MFYFEQACWKIVSFRKPKPAIARNKRKTKHPAIFTPASKIHNRLVVSIQQLYLRNNVSHSPFRGCCKTSLNVFYVCRLKKRRKYMM